ncbi:MAG: methylenetetrahydrofolate reductase [NAD(P)H] [Pseudomonadota bacterium]|nr:methylenetetrahydrofolate reductase [NAD(P)H] [Pseudomonadota bacterium]
MKSQQRHERIFSVEFFPPRSPEGEKKLHRTRQRLSSELDPRFFSVTFGAGGSTREKTLETVLEIAGAGCMAAPHISGIGADRDQVHQVIETYRDNGIRHVIALRGDIPSGVRHGGDFRYASDLVRFIREETGDHFHIDVAAYPEFHPEAASARDDLEHFRQKVEAGANSAITQYFYNAEAYFRFIDRCEAMGLDLPVVPGIMPIINFRQLARFSGGCGAEIPRWLRWRLEDFGDDTDSLRAFGVDVVTRLCDDLLTRGAPGLHFYTMNLALPTIAIWKNLGLDVRGPVSESA